MFSCVLFKKIGHPFPASTALAYQVAQTHQPSPSLSPGNPNSGWGVIRSLPASLHHSKNSVVTFAHTVCAKVNNEILEWLKEAGNDLITPHPEFGFPGLKDGDSWCVCASWYAKAVEAGKGCPIFLKKTHEKTLKLIPIEVLKKFAIDLS